MLDDVDFRWLNEPADSTRSATELAIAAGAHTDWFVDPGTGTVKADAPALLTPEAGDYVFSACVTAGLAATFDAGALVLWHDERTWAKLALELSPQGEPMVVSVVTRGTSDDCNSRVVDGNSLWLRIAQIGAAHAFHVSSDGRRWDLVRHFSLGQPQLEVGFEAQSPTGEGCRAVFSDVRLEALTLADLRSGD